jgi:hypothetical protein
MQERTDPVLSVPSDVRALRGLAIGLRRRGTRGDDHIAATIDASANLLEALADRMKYLEDSLVAATTGELPERFDLNQLLLAKRTKSYIKWLEETVDPRDKLVDKKQGS